MRLLLLLWTLLVAAPALGQPVARVQLGHTQSAHFVASPDGRLAVGNAFQESAFLLWSVDQGRILRLIEHPPGAAAVAFSGATTLRVADAAGLRDVDAATGAVTAELPSPWEAEPDCLQLSPGGRWVAWCEGLRLRVAEVGGAARTLVRLESLAGWVRLTDGGVASLTDEKGVRVWDLGSGERLAEIPALGGGALAGDGSAVAVRTREGVELHALRTGEVRKLAIPGGNPLALSEDGALVALQVFGEGTRVVAADGSERYASDRESFTARFLADGRVLLSPAGGTVLVDPAAGAVVWDLPGRSGPRALAFSGDGRYLALTGADQVSVWGLDALSPRWSRDDLGDPYGMEDVAWDADGRLVHWDGGGVQVLDIASGATVARRTLPGPVRDTIPEGDGLWLVGGNEVATWDPTSDAVALRYTAPDGAYGLFDAVRRDDLVVARGSVGVYVWQGDDPEPMVKRRRLTAFDLEISPDGRTLAVASWEGVRLVGLPDLKPIGELPTGEVTMSVAWSPDGRQLVSGDVLGRVTLWDAGGARIVAERRLGGSVEDVAFSPSGRHVAAASPRDTALLWDLVSGNDARLASAAGGDWLIHTADGLFDGSRDGAALVAMVDGLDAYGIEQLALRNNRPDVILERLGLGDPDVIAHFRARYERRARRAGLVDRAQGAEVAIPEARVVSRTQEGRELRLTVDLAAHGAPLARADVFVDGVPVRPEGWPLQGDAATLDVAVGLSPGANDVEVSATDTAGAESARALVHARWEGFAPRVLWYVGLGVSDYADSALDLGFAHKDAEDLAARLARLEGFDRIEARTWTDGAATRAALDEARTFLAGAAADDVVVVFVAGHGQHARDVEATWYFLTHEADPERLSDTAAPFEAVEALIRDVPARKKVLLLDACESGELEEDAPALAALDTAQARGVRVVTGAPAAVPPPPRPWLWDRERYVYVDLVRRSGAVVFSSSRGGELSYESAALGNGYFTEELLAALSSDVADADGDGLVSLAELRRYVGRAVAERSDDRQHPTVDRDNPRMRLELAPSPP